MSWLRNNVSSIIALLWCVAAISIFIMLIFQGDKSIKETVQNITILILGYYFGSTRAMNDKFREEKKNPNSPNSNQ
jgi:hypothetical protein